LNIWQNLFRLINDKQLLPMSNINEHPFDQQHRLHTNIYELLEQNPALHTV